MTYHTGVGSESCCVLTSLPSHVFAPFGRCLSDMYHVTDAVLALP